MKELSDEELQQLIAQQMHSDRVDTPTNEDAQTYQLLFEALKQEPVKAHPAGLAQNVYQALLAGQHKADRLNYNLWIGFTVTGVLLLVCIILLAFSPAMIALAAAHFKILLFLAVTIGAVQYADQKLVKRAVV